ncbi:MAG: aldo/keto reductase [Sphingomonadales bacterium]|nr:aldo/keto reductase [Sphingomonadales bacterium]
MRYRLLGKSGLKVSEVALGTGTFGTAWGWGCTREESLSLFGQFVDAGGNLFDCADGYQNGEAETMIGEFVQHDRDNFILSTKYTTAVGALSVAKTGNSRKAMMHGIEGSLKRLRTDHVDIFWVHMPDLVTPTDEIIRGLEDVVCSGKALYIGISDFPAWKISRAVTLAELRAWSPISAIQIEYSLAERTAERELIPMADAYGLSVFIWASLGGGILTGKYRRGEVGRLTKGGGSIRAFAAGHEDAILDVIESVAADLGRTTAQVAIAWVRAKETRGCSFIPILGARNGQQLRDNLAAIALDLSPEHVARLDAASAIEPGFPHELVSRNEMKALHTGGFWEQIVQRNSAIP